MQPHVVQDEVAEAPGESEARRLEHDVAQLLPHLLSIPQNYDPQDAGTLSPAAPLSLPTFEAYAPALDAMREWYPMSRDLELLSEQRGHLETSQNFAQDHSSVAQMPLCSATPLLRRSSDPLAFRASQPLQAYPAP